MTATYTPGGNTDKDRIRFMIGDTNGLSGTTVTKAFLQDEEITLVAADQPIRTYAAAICADAIAAKLYAEADQVDIGKTSIIKRRAKGFADLADKLRKTPGDMMGGDGSGVPLASMHVGGVDKAESVDLYRDTTVQQPSFFKGRDDHTLEGEVPSDDIEP